MISMRGVDGICVEIVPAPRAASIRFCVSSPGRQVYRTLRAVAAPKTVLPSSTGVAARLSQRSISFRVESVRSINGIAVHARSFRVRAIGRKAEANDHRAARQSQGPRTSNVRSILASQVPRRAREAVWWRVAPRDTISANLLCNQFRHRNGSSSSRPGCDGPWSARRRSQSRWRSFRFSPPGFLMSLRLNKRRSLPARPLCPALPDATGHGQTD